MDEEIRGLIAECIQIEEELGLLTPIMLSLNPSWTDQETGAETLAARARKRFKERWNQLGGWDKVKTEYTLQEKELAKRLSELAEVLDEEGFEIERLRSRVPEDQFGWLLSQKGKIKKHLRGIALVGQES